jgi:hypothetical protein
MTRTRTRKPRPADVFEDWTAANGDRALLRYRDRGEGADEATRHTVYLYWPFCIDRQSLVWNFATIEAARVGWGEARLYLTSLGFTRTQGE